MSPIRLMIALLVLLIVTETAVAAEVIAVDQIEKGFFVSSDPTLTFYWPGSNSKAVLVFVPGGEGVIGLRPGQTDNRAPFHQMLRRLSDPALTRGQVDVVLMDSPAPLSPRQSFPAARTAGDHLVRIESVVRYYKQRTGLPVWLMGHSNGGISLAEFVRHLQKKGSGALLAGLISSGSRNEARFEPPFEWPMLVMHHQQDGCSQTRPEAARSRYESVRQFDPSPVEFFLVTEGAAQSADPCRSGFHMYSGAAEQAAAAIDDFLARQAKATLPATPAQGGITPSD